MSEQPDILFTHVDQIPMVEGELEREERISWTGRPHSWRFVPGTIPGFVFGVLITTVLLLAFLPLPAQGWGPTLLFCLFVGPFFLIGLVLLSSPLRAIRRAYRTLYVVTDRRAITFYRGIFSTSVLSFGLEQLTDLQRKERHDGSGDITFMSSVKGLGGSEGAPRRASARDVGFFGIGNVREVEEVLKAIAARTDARGESYTERETG